MLGVPSIGVDDDFFSLGGDSILGAEAVARLREVTGPRDLPLVSIVRAPTVAGMARELDRDVGALALGPDPRSSPAAAGSPFFFVHGGDGEVLGFVALARAARRRTGRSTASAPAGSTTVRSPGRSVEEMAVGYLELDPVGAAARALLASGGFCFGRHVAARDGAPARRRRRSRSRSCSSSRGRRVADPRYPLWLAAPGS